MVELRLIWEYMAELTLWLEPMACKGDLDKFVHVVKVMVGFIPGEFLTKVGDDFSFKVFTLQLKDIK